MLSKIGIGELSEWNYDSIEEYYCMTDYYSFGNFSSGIQNNIAFYLIGNELYITSLELVLNIYNNAENEAAIRKFSEVTEATFNCLSLPNSSTLMKSIKKVEDFSQDFETYKVLLFKEISGIISLKLIIETKK